MSTRIRFLGHASLLVETDGQTILIDPFLTGNPAARTSADELPADFIVVSHGHGDHVGDTIAIAGRTGATVVSNFEIVHWFQAQGVAQAHPMHLGGSHGFPFGRLKLTLAFHGSGLPDGSYGGNPAGLLLTLNDGTRIYDAADTALFSDMALIGAGGLDVAFLPIGDNFTMGPDDALEAVKLLKPKRVVPIHYNTWPVIAQDAAAWAERVRRETTTEPIVMPPGDWLEL